MWFEAPDESTWVGLLRLSLRARGARSLKDKRKHLAGLKDRVRARFGVRVAEVGHLDDRSRAVVAIVSVSNDARVLRSLLDKIIDDIRMSSELLIEASDVDIHRPMDQSGNLSDEEDWSDSPSTSTWGYDPDHG